MGGSFLGRSIDLPASAWKPLWELGRSAPGWEPLQKLDEVERTERNDRPEAGSGNLGFNFHAFPLNPGLLESLNPFNKDLL
jgi:hypothetical protein